MEQRPYRRTIRLPEWDYSAPATYFVTICTHNRDVLFADALLRETAANAWLAVPRQPHARRVILDTWVIMPNHVHGLITLSEEGYSPAPVGNKPAKGSLGVIIGNYKMRVTKQIKALQRAIGCDMRVWQRGYWERIVRNERELLATREYIRLNPQRWSEDRENLDHLLERMNYHDL